MVMTISMLFVFIPSFSLPARMNRSNGREIFGMQRGRVRRGRNVKNLHHVNLNKPRIKRYLIRQCLTKRKFHGNQISLQ
jgi:hypothetical protein